MFDLTFGILMLVVALLSAGFIGFLVTSERFNPIKLGALLGLLIYSFILGVSSVLKSETGTLLSNKALVKNQQYATVCTGKSADRQVAILEDVQGLRAYELQKVPPHVFSFTGNPDNPYEEVVIMTHEELAKKLNELIKALKNAQQKKVLQKSTTTQNGH